MTALTDPQILDIRQCTGDNNAPYDITPDVLSVIWLDPDQGNQSLCRTKVFVLRRRKGMWVNIVDDTGNITGINARGSQKLTQIIDDLKYWESVCGMAAGQTIGTDSTRMKRKDASRLNRIFGWQADAAAERYITGYSSDDDDV